MVLYLFNSLSFYYLCIKCISACTKTATLLLTFGLHRSDRCLQNFEKLHQKPQTSNLTSKKKKKKKIVLIPREKQSNQCIRLLILKYTIEEKRRQTPFTVNGLTFNLKDHSSNLCWMKAVFSPYKLLLKWGRKSLDEAEPKTWTF